MSEAPRLSLTEVNQFLTYWLDVTGGDHLTLVAIGSVDRSIGARTVTRNDSDMNAWITERQEAQCNLYFQLNETRADCATKPGKSDMVAVLCRHADVDPDDAYFSLVDERYRLARLAEYLVKTPKCAPTAVIDSGNGIQLIWAVEREVSSPEVVARIEAENQEIAELLGGDATQNVDRLFRLPGTVNFPTEAKARRGRAPSRARLLHAGTTCYTVAEARGLPWDLWINLSGSPGKGLIRKKAQASEQKQKTTGTNDEAAVTALMAELEAAGADRITKQEDLPAPLATRLRTALKTRSQLDDRWNGTSDDLTERGLDDSRSGLDMSLAAMLKAAGFSHLEAGLILCAFPHGKANGDDWPKGADRLRHVARTVIRSHEPDPTTWRDALLRGEGGTPLRLLANAITALGGAPEWRDVLAWNEFSSRLTVTRQLPGPPQPHLQVPRELSEADTARVTDWLQHHGIFVNSGIAHEAVRAVADRNRFHPVRDYLNGLTWDGKPRLDTWLIDHLGAEASALNKAFGARWMIGLVARVMRPGCKLDTALILESRQGLMKSSVLSTLGDPWFTDHMPDLGSKDAMEQLQGVWIVELAELSSLGRAETHRVKAFLSTAKDRFRPSYGRVAADHPRQCGFGGTINPSGSGYLRDETGNRRFWCVKCAVNWPDDRRVDIAGLAAEKDQLWAEAVVRFRAGEPWWLDSSAEAEAEAAAEERFESDSREVVIQRYLRGKKYTRMDELFGSSCLNIPVDRQSRAVQVEIGRIMAALKWTRRRRRNRHGEREYVYLALGTNLGDVPNVEPEAQPEPGPAASGFRSRWDQRQN
jgi:predicted P-loop ATPase